LRNREEVIMARVEVKQKIKIYEVNGEDVPLVPGSYMEVNSHPGNKGAIVLVFDSKEISVIASDLKIAIDNAVNTNS
jgi:hypothetical protein